MAVLNISCSCVLVSDDISRSVPLVMAGMGHALLDVLDTDVTKSYVLLYM